MVLVFIGYLAVRRIPADVAVKARRSAVIALVGAVNIVIVNRSVGLVGEPHPAPAVPPSSPAKSATKPCSPCRSRFAVGMVLFAWLLLHRFRTAYLQSQIEDLEVDEALAERRAESRDLRTSGGSAMTHVGYLIAGLGHIGWLAVVAYAGWVLVRGRSLSRRVPENRRRWMMPDD